MLQAFGEVEDGLTLVSNDSEREAALARAIAANRRAFDRSTSQFQNGQASYLQLLDTETNLNIATDQQLQTRNSICVKSLQFTRLSAEGGRRRKISLSANRRAGGTFHQRYRSGKASVRSVRRFVICSGGR